MNLNRNGFTPRYPVNDNLNKLIGRVLKTNIFPTFLGRLIYIQKDRCYFEILPNPEWPKYNECAGNIEYITDHHVFTMKFEEEQ